MYKVTVTVPAASTNLGPGLEVLGLALSLHATVEMHVRADGQLHVSVQGEGKTALPSTLDNPVLRAAIRVFQHFESAPAGLQLNIANYIPWNAGLGARSALILGGIVAANNLVDGQLTTENVIDMALTLGAEYEAVTSALRGGLSVCSKSSTGSNLHRTVDVVPLRVVVVLPNLPDYSGGQDTLPDSVPLRDAIHNIGQTALVIEALRTGDLKLLRPAMVDRLHQAHRSHLIPAYEAVANAAYTTGALSVVVSGAGPALLAMAETHHTQIADAMTQAFAAAGIEARNWVLGVDRQGVVISVVE